MADTEAKTPEATQFNQNTLFRLNDAANDVSSTINAIVHSYTMEPATINGDGMDEALIKLLEIKDDLARLVTPSPRPAVVQSSNNEKPYAVERGSDGQAAPVPTNSDIANQVDHPSEDENEAIKYDVPTEAFREAGPHAKEAAEGVDADKTAGSSAQKGEQDAAA